MLFRLILIGLVAAAGAEPPAQADLNHAWEQGKAYCAHWTTAIQERMPDGPDAFLPDAAVPIDKTELAERPVEPAQAAPSVAPAIAAAAAGAQLVQGPAGPIDALGRELSQGLRDLIKNADDATAMLSRGGEACLAKVRDRWQSLSASLTPEPAVQNDRASQEALRATIVELDLMELEDAFEATSGTPAVAAVQPGQPAAAQSVAPEAAVDRSAVAANPEERDPEAAWTVPWEEPAAVGEIAIAAATADAPAADAPQARSEPAPTLRLAAALRLTGKALEAWAAVLQADAEGAQAVTR